MSVNQRKWKQEDGSMGTAWYIDVKVKLPGKPVVRVRDNAPINTRRGAEAYERQVRQQILNGTWGQKEVVVPTLASFAPQYIEASRELAKNKHSTVVSKEQLLRDHLVPEFGALRLDAISVATIEAYKAKKLKAGLKAKTVNNSLTVLRNLLEVAREREVVAYVPKVKWLKAQKPDFDFLDPAKAEDVAFLKAADPEWHPMLSLALNTGLRLGELLALKWEDIDLEQGRLMVRRTVWRGVEGLPKGGRTRQVDLNQEATKALKAAQLRRSGPYVFHDGQGARMTDGQTKWPIYRAAEASGIGRRIGWHVLRHSFASKLVMMGRPLAEVQAALGHATITMTERYAHLSPLTKRQTVMVLDQPFQLAGANKNPLGPGRVTSGSQTAVSLPN